MHIFKLTPTRAVSHYGKFDNYLYSGSSYNRKFTNELKATEKKAQKDCTTFDGETPDTDGATLQPEENKPKIRKSGISNSCIMQDAVCTVRRTRTLSPRSKYKIRDKIESLYNASDGKRFTFLTLSFINSVDDKTGQKCLNKFLTATRKRFGKFLYIWVAERQTDTKNIHFHLISNKFFPIAEFNALWILQQYNAGIKSDLYSYEQIIAAYADKGSYVSSKGKLVSALQLMLNPVDVKQIKSIAGLSNYLTLYVTKNKDTFDCSVWHCCRTVSKLFTTQLIHRDTFIEAQDTSVNYAVNYQTGEVYESKTFFCDYAIVVNILNKEHFRKQLTDINQLNAAILNGTLKDRKNKPTDIVIGGIPTIDILNYHNDFCVEYQAKKQGFNNPKTDCKTWSVDRQKNFLQRFDLQYGSKN